MRIQLRSANAQRSAPGRRIAPFGRAALLGCAALFALLCCGDPEHSAGAPDGGGEAAKVGPAGDTFASAPHPKNVLLVVVDTLRRDHLGCYGHPRATSPRLDELAAESMRFERVVSQAPWTTPSIGALLTSQYPTRLGIRSNRSRIPEAEILLSEVLQAEGLRTAAVVSHTFCSSEWGFAQGFDRFDESNVRGHFATVGPDVADRALEFLAEDDPRPFFLWLHFFDPHFAYKEQPGFEFHEPGVPAYQGVVESSMPFNELQKRHRQLSPEDIAEVQRLYDSEIALTDQQIGRVLDALRADGRYEDTLIVFTGDHGEEFLEHGDIGHTKTLYEEVLGVPLIVRMPGRPAAVVREPVGLVDVYPTVLDALGFPAPGPLEGRSLLAEPSGEEERPIFSETQRKNLLVSLRRGSFKYLYDRGTEAGKLFDLASDPAETKDATPRELDRARTMRQEVLDHIERMEREARTAEVDIDEATRHRLDALGYEEKDPAKGKDPAGGGGH